MNKKNVLTVLIIMIALIATLLLLSVVRLKQQPTVMDDVNIASVDGIVPVEGHYHLPELPSVSVGDYDAEKSLKLAKDTSSENRETSKSLLSLVAESTGISPTEKILITTRWEDGEMIVITNKTMASKIIRVESDTEEVAEYIQIALATVARMKIPDDIEPIVEIQGEWVIVTFPWRPPTPPPKGYRIAGPSYFAKIIIDIKTKVVTIAPEEPN